MKLECRKISKSLNVAYRKQSITTDEIKHFKTHLQKLFRDCKDAQKVGETEEHFKNILSDFLKDTYYKDRHAINTKEKTDLVIHQTERSSSVVEVLFEVKAPDNKGQMVSNKKPNVKAMQQLLRYYMRERYGENNLNIRHLIITNIFDWYIIDGAEFETLISNNSSFKNTYKDLKRDAFGLSKADWFYENMSKPFLDEIDTLKCTSFNLKDIQPFLNKNGQDNDTQLIPYYKILSPQHLLKKPIKNDSNSLNKEFYNELLYILGLEEIKDKGKKIIQRCREENRKEGSLLENTIHQIKVSKREKGAKMIEEKIFSHALELCITWLNRILFLKLLEGQLKSYQKEETKDGFIDAEKITEFDDLQELFFEVLAVPFEQRTDSVNKKFGNIPYLNSSLFESTDLENTYFKISSLKDRLKMPFYNQTVLTDDGGKKLKGENKTLKYLLDFLEAYDFSSVGKEQLQEKNKTLINASILGLIFEKINGYQDGSFFTPGFITMYMCRETIRKAIIQKFNDHYAWKCTTISQLYNNLENKNIREANDVFNSLKICDPAVGSGHFLVSALNEMIATKQELRILTDSEGKTLRDYDIEIENDELIVRFEDNIFDYNYKNTESRRVQETLFEEKRRLIENCLFGVDINAKSIIICQLRLWIELLKHAYYTKQSHYKELETLPNIDINMKQGNSLVSQFDLKEKNMKVGDAFTLGNDQKTQKISLATQKYKEQVFLYKETKDKRIKRQARDKIEELKKEFIGISQHTDRDFLHLEKAKKDLAKLVDAFGSTEKIEFEKSLEITNKKVEKLTNIWNDKLKNLYGSAFEWRFEFPEVLDDEGHFLGFDAVIGNPPYIRQESIKTLKPYLKEHYDIFHSMADILTYFVERSYQILKNKGAFMFIISNKFTRTNYGKVMRGFLLQHSSLSHFIDFSSVAVFEEATVDAAILGFYKQTPTNSSSLLYAQVDKEALDTQDFFQYIYHHRRPFQQSSLTQDSWAFESLEVLAIKTKVEQQGKKLKDWDISINYGIKTGFNEAFIIDRKKKEELIALDPNSADIIKPILRGKDIDKWHANFQNLWLINSHNGLKKKKIPPINVKKDYTAIFSHLKKYQDKLQKRLDKGNHWTNLRNCAYLKDFEKPKIIYVDISIEPSFIYDDKKYYTNDRCFIITGEKLFFLTALFNSKLGEFLFRIYCDKLGEKGIKFKQIINYNISIPYISNEEEKPFKDLVLKIQEAKKANPKADVSPLESEIDQLVYTLYGITKEEQKTIEQA